MHARITISPDRVNFPLRQLYVGRSSSAYIEIVGAPRSLTTMQLHIGRPGVDFFSVVTCYQHDDGIWTAYVSPLYFPTSGDANYHITAKDDHGNSSWLGKGVCTVEDSVLQSGNAPLIPEDTYVRGANGLWYKLTCELDENGIPYPVMSSEGVTR